MNTSLIILIISSVLLLNFLYLTGLGWTVLWILNLVFKTSIPTSFVNGFLTGVLVFLLNISDNYLMCESKKKNKRK